MVNIWNGLKRLILGPTSVFAVRNGSVPIVGLSFVAVYQERTKYPLKITGIQFAIDPSAQSEYRICVNGEKVFPYSEVNNLDSDYHNLMPIEIAAGELMTVEIRSRNKE